MILLDDEYNVDVIDHDNENVLAIEEEIVSNQEVRLHAFTNNSDPRIFYIAATYKENSLEVLIDTGSHNNFIQEGLVDRLSLLSVRVPKFRVYMGNGQFLLCDHLCMNIYLLL